jgi:hypothetical protein
MKFYFSCWQQHINSVLNNKIRIDLYEWQLYLAYLLLEHTTVTYDLKSVAACNSDYQKAAENVNDTSYTFRTH